ncbi:MAG: hypothetical protein OES46_10585 [Gammaproteobacteria bacterium]|jgi:hypothetical protein|nr:hypothetical protein [Gammaproteobacteria bacterium]
MVEKLGYALLIIVAVVWLLGMLAGMFIAWPYGIVGLIAFVGIGLLFIKVLRERLASKEDSHYSKNVER